MILDFRSMHENVGGAVSRWLKSAANYGHTTLKSTIRAERPITHPVPSSTNTLECTPHYPPSYLLVNIIFVARKVV